MQRIAYRSVLALFTLLAVLAPTVHAQPSMRMDATKRLPDPDWSRIGDDDHAWIRRCFSRNAWGLPWWIGLKRCPTYPGKSLAAVGTDDENVLARLEKAEWKAWSDTTRRKPQDTGLEESKWPWQRIRVMPRSSHFRFSAISNDGIIIAQINAVATGARDKRLGIGGLTADFEDTFYLAVSGYDAIDTSTSTALSGDSAFSRKVSNWYVYGVTKKSPGRARALVRIGNSGTFRWCGINHVKEHKNETAMFLGCLDYHEIAAQLRDKSNAVVGALRAAYPSGQNGVGTGEYDVTWFLQAISRATTATAQANTALKVLTPAILTYWRNRLEGFESSPAWMPCGAGCCTADSF